MQEANSSDREKLERARRELASITKIKQVLVYLQFTLQSYEVYRIPYMYTTYIVCTVCSIFALIH